MNLAVLRILSGKILERLSLFAERFQTMPNKIGWKSEQQKTPAFTGISLLSNWLRGLDLNQRPSGYEPERLLRFIWFIWIILHFLLVVCAVVGDNVGDGERGCSSRSP